MGDKPKCQADFETRQLRRRSAMAFRPDQINETNAVFRVSKYGEPAANRTDAPTKTCAGWMSTSARLFGRCG